MKEEDFKKVFVDIDLTDGLEEGVAKKVKTILGSSTLKVCKTQEGTEIEGDVGSIPTNRWRELQRLVSQGEN